MFYKTQRGAWERLHEIPPVEYNSAMLESKVVVLGVSGSIAAYKAADVASMLVKAGAEVHVIMTRNATNIINPIAFETLTGRKCLVETFDRGFEFNVAHVSLAKRADCLAVAPATANVIAKFAHGLADDMLSTTFLAAECPRLVFPAMNTRMLENPATQANIGTCRSRGILVFDSADGRLACGDSGRGKLPPPAEIFAAIERTVAQARRRDFEGVRVLVTAGPTREAIDPVRFISNRSTGRMGYAVAEAAASRGADVTLVSGPTTLAPPPSVRLVRVESAAEMFEAVKSSFGECDVVVKAAAVADYRPVSVAAEKIKKSDGGAAIELERTDDILAWLGGRKGGRFLCGFSMETENLVENSRRKLERKNLDLVVANSLRTAGAGFGVDTNVVTLISRDGEEELPLMGKVDVAHRILDEIAARRGARQSEG